MRGSSSVWGLQLAKSIKVNSYIYDTEVNFCLVILIASHDGVEASAWWFQAVLRYFLWGNV